MDTRTAVERWPAQATPVRHDGIAPDAKQRNEDAHTRRDDAPSAADLEARFSLDPLRHTDRYRLVMPFKLRW